jgi:hypothetical protein
MDAARAYIFNTLVLDEAAGDGRQGARSGGCVLLRLEDLIPDMFSEPSAAVGRPGLLCGSDEERWRAASAAVTDERRTGIGLLSVEKCSCLRSVAESMSTGQSR